MSGFLPLSVPNFGEKEAAYAAEAITSGWVSTSGAKVSEFEEALAAYVEDALVDADDFDMTVCEQSIMKGKLSGREVCLLLYEQGVLKKKGDSDYTALKSGSLNSYDFIRRKLKSLLITPGQIGLDPCS